MDGVATSAVVDGPAVVMFGKRAAVVIRGIFCLVVGAVEEVVILVGDGVVPGKGGAEVGTGGAEVGTGGAEVGTGGAEVGTGGAEVGGRYTVVVA